MFKKHEDGTYSFSARFWTYAIVATAIICWIGWRTQTVATRTEALNAETTQYATQTNDCLNQVVATLKDRTQLNAKLDDLVNRRSSTLKAFVSELAAINPDATEALRAPEARLALQHFLDTSAQIDSERASLLYQRSLKPYPDPSCGNKLPGE